MNIKKIVMGEPVPDKDDPKYKERHEKDVEAGRKFADKVGLSKAAARIQRFASRNPKFFLGIIFVFVLLIVALNLYRLNAALSSRNHPTRSVERQEKELHFKRHHAPSTSASQPQVNVQSEEEYGTNRQD